MTQAKKSKKPLLHYSLALPQQSCFMMQDINPTASLRHAGKKCSTTEVHVQSNLL